MKRAPLLVGNFFCQEKFARAVTNRVFSPKVKFFLTKKTFSDAPRALYLKQNFRLTNKFSVKRKCLVTNLRAVTNKTFSSEQKFFFTKKVSPPSLRARQVKKNSLQKILVLKRSFCSGKMIFL